jgi:hypothetical protein
MADQTLSQTQGSDGLEALTDERMKMWSGFTNATLAVVIFVVVVLVGMAVFLL